MATDPRRNRGAGSPGGRPGRADRPRPDVRRGRARVAGERAAERRRQGTAPKTRARRRLALPTPRLPRFRWPRAERPRPAPATSSSRGLTAVLAVLVLLAATAVGYLAVQLRQAQATESAAVEAQVTAARYAEQLLSYHHAHLDRDFAQAQELMTDSFVQEYTEATGVVRDQAIEDSAVIRASTVATSVVSASPDTVKTLLFVNQSTTTGQNGGSPSIDLNRVVMTLVDDDGTWRVSDLDAM